MAKVYARFQVKTAQKPYLFRAAHNYMAYITEYPLPRDSVMLGCKLVIIAAEFCTDCKRFVWDGIYFSFLWKRMFMYCFIIKLEKNANADL